MPLLMAPPSQAASLAAGASWVWCPFLFTGEEKGPPGNQILPLQRSRKGSLCSPRDGKTPELPSLCFSVPDLHRWGQLLFKNDEMQSDKKAPSTLRRWRGLFRSMAAVRPSASPDLPWIFSFCMWRRVFRRFRCSAVLNRGGAEKHGEPEAQPPPDQFLVEWNPPSELEPPSLPVRASYVLFAGNVVDKPLSLLYIDAAVGLSA